MLTYVNFFYQPLHYYLNGFASQRKKKGTSVTIETFLCYQQILFINVWKHCTEAKPSSVPQNWWICSRREATTSGKKPGIRWQISIFPHAALKYESIKRRIIICTLEIQPQKVRREIPYEILSDAPDENPFTCVNSKIDKNETLERFTCIAIFQASGRKKKIWLTKQQLQHFVALGEYMYIACRTRFLRT